MSRKNDLPNLKQIRTAHSWKRDYEKYLFLSRFVFRPIGFLLTWFATRTGITSEAVSWMSGAFGIAGCVCLIIGSEIFLPVGMGLLILFNLLDCVDGSIARTLRTENPYGRFLDSICGAVVDLTFWGVIGIVAFNHPHLVAWKAPFGNGKAFWLAIGAAVCLFSIYLVYLENAFNELLRGEWNILTERQNPPDVVESEGTSKNSKGKYTRFRYALRMINNNLRVRENHYFLFIIFYFGTAIDLLLLLYLFYYFIYDFLILVVFCMRGKKIRANHLQL